MRVPARLTAATRLVHRERLSRIYLAVVGVATALLLLDTALVSHRHASPTAFLLLVVTLPWTPLLWSLAASAGGLDLQETAFGWSGWTLAVVAALVSAVVNAVLLGYAARFTRRRAAASGSAAPHI
ncbi:SCO4225 family membrane protein [Streptomyces sp. NPDC049040]|uniref:SCO4225 family membrane protein n=1 Tax=Streptomyces sp. NPDC049040 TaxID=3365593 RepID=UPI003711F1F4